MKYHIVIGAKIMSGDLKSSQVVNMTNGANTTVTANDLVQINDFATVIQADIQVQCAGVQLSPLGLSIGGCSVSASLARSKVSSSFGFANLILFPFPRPATASFILLTTCWSLLHFQTALEFLFWPLPMF